MKTQLVTKPLLLAAAAAALFLSSSLAQSAVDVNAAKSLAKKNNCMKCHAVNKKKEGPTFKEVANKYRGDPNAESKLVYHITSGEKAKLTDGHEEEHKIVKTSPPKDMAQVKNLVQYILSQ
jgi:cytochrome c